MPAAMRRSKRRTMQRFWLGALVAGVLIAVLAEPRAEPAPAEDALVLAADTTLGYAIRDGDKSIARRLLALQFTYADENGKIHERKDFLADLKGVAAASATDPKVTIYGLVAMVTGHRNSVPGSDTFFLDIWAKQKGAWRALTMQDVVLATGAPPAAPGAEAKLGECKNPCEAIPYRVRSPAEQDIINSFQAIEKANIAHDAEGWSRYVADEFVLYRSGRAPIAKSGHVARIERQKEENAAVTVSPIEAMRLSVYGDGAAMISTHTIPDDLEPLFRAARVWVKRNGQWQLVISAETEIKSP